MHYLPFCPLLLPSKPLSKLVQFLFAAQKDFKLQIFFIGRSLWTVKNAQAEARIKEVEDIARRKVSQDFHARTVASLERQVTDARKTSSNQETSGKAEVARLTGLLKERTDQLEQSNKEVHNPSDWASRNTMLRYRGRSELTVDTPTLYLLSMIRMCIVG